MNLQYSQSDTDLAGSRFYLSYSGSAPSGANCTTLASDIAGLANTSIVPLLSSQFALVGIDVLDIASDTGASGQWSGEYQGPLTGATVAPQVAQIVEYDIARRYRGGKPRMYLPPADGTKTSDATHWAADWTADINSNFETFFSGIAALSVGSMGELAHVSLSYYKGFTNIVNSSGRERAVPTYRSAAVVDPVTGYAARRLFGSQRRRRAATTY